MKILMKENRDELLANRLPWWVGYSGACRKCSTSFLLEKEDTVKEYPYDDTVVEARCPGSFSDREKCNATVTVYRRE